MIPVTDNIFLDERELEFSFVRSSGPGGQNVNKVSTAVQLRFDVPRSACLSWGVKQRLIRLAGHRVTAEGVLIIDARQHRLQSANRQAGVDRLVDLIRQAARPPKPRHATKPTRASRQRRLEGKKHHSATKSLRRQKPGME